MPNKKQRSIRGSKFNETGVERVERYRKMRRLKRSVRSQNGWGYVVQSDYPVWAWESPVHGEFCPCCNPELR